MNTHIYIYIVSYNFSLSLSLSLYIYICIYYQSFKCYDEASILMSKCFDHKSTFLEPHSKIPPDRHIYAAKAIV